MTRYKNTKIYKITNDIDDLGLIGATLGRALHFARAWAMPVRCVASWGNHFVLVVVGETRILVSCSP
eukprot:SAG31_NODE_28014_length_416_cov_1.779180_2_plen_66_part_01